MTESEAIKLSNKLYANITSNENNIIKTDDYIEFVGIATKSIEKQIPKKPLYKHYEDEGEKPYIKIYCPNNCHIQVSPVTH